MSGHGRLHRHVSPLQGRTRAEGHASSVRSRRRQRLAVSEPARLRAVGARSARDHRTRRASSTAARAKFDYRMAPFGKPTPARATWDVEYDNVDLVQALRLSRDPGTAAGGTRVGPEPARVAARQVGAEDRPGRGDRRSRPPDMRPMTRELPAELVAELSALPDEAGRSIRSSSLGYLPIAGHIVYALDPQWIRLARRAGRPPIEHLRRVRGPDRVRRAIAHPVPRHAASTGRRATACSPGS